MTADRLTDEQIHELALKEGDYDERTCCWSFNGDSDCRYNIFNFARAVIAADQSQAPAEGDVMDMALCESQRVVLREGQLYRFRRVGDCETCAAMSAASLEAYGEPPANVQPKGIPVAWSRQQFIHDDDGYSIGTDEPELHWGKEPPDDETSWHPLYAAAGVTTRDAALEEAARLCERWNTTPGRKLAGEIRALAAQAPAPAHADGMLETLVYAAMMHNGKPKTVAEFERAAANVADMFQRRAEVTHNKPVASIYISDDGSREFDDWRVDLPPGNHQLFTAPRPDQPQPESLPHPGAPEADEMLDKLLAEYGHPANAKNAARAGYMAARRLLQHARQPLPAVEDAEPIGWGGVMATCVELCDPHFIAQQDLEELKRYAGNWNSTYRFFPIYAPRTQPNAQSKEQS